jgi:hypothetical protein
MSSEAQGYVYKTSHHRGATFNVQLAIADTVNDAHGNRFWLTVPTLAAKARVNLSSARRALIALVADGSLVLVEPATKRAPAVYEMPIDWAHAKQVWPPVHGAPRGSTMPPLVPSTDGTTPPQRVHHATSEVAPCHPIPIETQENPKEREQVKHSATGRTRRRPEAELLTPDRLAFAMECGLSRKEATTEWATMGDHEFQSPRADWSATWRNWVRRWKPTTPPLPYRPSFAPRANLSPDRPRPEVPGPAETRERLRRQKEEAGPISGDRPPLSALLAGIGRPMV